MYRIKVHDEKSPVGQSSSVESLPTHRAVREMSGMSFGDAMDELGLAARTLCSSKLCGLLCEVDAVVDDLGEGPYGPTVANDTQARLAVAAVCDKRDCPSDQPVEVLSRRIKALLAGVVEGRDNISPAIRERMDLARADAAAISSEGEREIAEIKQRIADDIQAVNVRACKETGEVFATAYGAITDEVNRIV